MIRSRLRKGSVRNGSFVAGVIAITLASAASAQEPIRIEAAPAIRVTGDGGWAHSVQISTDINNGLKTVTIVAEGKKHVIRETDEAIEVDMTKTYGPDNLEELKQNHPDLHMHVASFPTTSGDSQVKFYVEIVTTYRAANPEELEQKHPEAFEIYKKYVNGAAPFLEIRGGLIEIPRVEIEAPDFEGFEIPRIEIDELDIKAPKLPPPPESSDKT